MPFPSYRISAGCDVIKYDSNAFSNLQVLIPNKRDENPNVKAYTPVIIWDPDRALTPLFLNNCVISQIHKQKVYIIGRGFLNVIASKLIACFIYIRLKIIITINIYFFKGVVDRKDYLYHEIKMEITVHSEPY